MSQTRHGVDPVGFGSDTLKLMMVLIMMPPAQQITCLLQGRDDEVVSLCFDDYAEV